MTGKLSNSTRPVYKCFPDLSYSATVACLPHNSHIAAGPTFQIISVRHTQLPLLWAPIQLLFQTRTSYVLQIQ
jgi:hypothetical protein